MTSICSREEIDLVKPRTAVRPERRPRVAVDVRGLQQALRNSPEGGLGGVGRYGFHLLEAFQQREETDQVLLVDKGPVPKRLLELAAGSERFSFYPMGLRGAVERFHYGRAAPLVGRLESPVVNHHLSHLNPSLIHIIDQPPPPRLRLRPRIVTAHDLVVLHEATQSHQSSPLSSLAIANERAMSSADVIVCVSHATRNDVARVLNVENERLVVIYPGVDTQLFSPWIWRTDGLLTFKVNGFVAAPNPPMLLARHNWEIHYIRLVLSGVITEQSLEIGCGFGRLSPIFAEFSRGHTAVDINQDALTTARPAPGTDHWSSTLKHLRQ